MENSFEKIKNMEWKSLKNEIVERRKRTCYRIEISKGYEIIMKENKFFIQS